MHKSDSLKMLGVVAVALFYGCAQPNEEQQETTTAPMDQQSEHVAAKRQAVATLEAKSGSSLTGEATFTEQNYGEVTFEVHIEGVSPGLHAVHIHEVGDCSAPDGSSAGGHWNPTNQPHGKWGEEPHHLGDIGNIDVGEDGQGHLSLTTDAWSLEDMGDRSVLGKAVVVHSGADDFTSQPSGAAGDRIGCGVIELKEGVPDAT
jgi:superoxide dismutase, Cu-Zn family